MAALLNWSRGCTVSLFERIQKKDESPSSSIGLKGFIHSIKNNLSHILNTHPGTSQSAVELGIMDLNDATSSSVDIYNNIAKIIKTCILDFEPRIVEVNVYPLLNEVQPLTLFFYAEAIVSFQDNQHLISFNLYLDNDHHYYLDMSNII